MRNMLRKEVRWKLLPLYVMFILVVATGIFALWDGLRSEAEGNLTIRVGDVTLDNPKNATIEIENPDTKIEVVGGDLGKLYNWSVSDTGVLEAKVDGKAENIGCNVTGAAICFVSPKTVGECTVNLKVDDNLEMNLKVQVKFKIDKNDSSVFKEINDKSSMVMITASGAAISEANKGGYKSIEKLKFKPANTVVSPAAVKLYSKDTTVVTVTEGGIVSAVGAGHTIVTAVYYYDNDEKARESIDVYVVPDVYVKGESLKSVYDMKSGESIYVDALFAGNDLESVYDKTNWVIYKNSTKGSKYLGDYKNESELFKLEPDYVEKNKLIVTAKAGTYVVDFYPDGIYSINDAGEINTQGVEPYRVKIVVNPDYSDRDVTLNIGDQFSLLDALNISAEDMDYLYKVDLKLPGKDDSAMKNGYISLDQATYMITALQMTSSTHVNAEIVSKVTGTKITISFRVVENLLMDIGNVSVTVGSSIALTLSSYDGEITWASSDERYATVDEYGVVTGVQETSSLVKDYIVITVTSKRSDGSIKTASCNVRVKPAIDVITLNKDKAELIVGEQETIVASSEVTFKSSDIAVFDCSAKDKSKSTVITAKTAGSAILIAMDTDGYAIAFCKVTVVVEMQKISLKYNNVDTTALTVNLSQGFVRFRVAYEPKEAGTNTLIWESSNAGVASRDPDEEGLYILKGAGTTIITVRPARAKGTVSAQCILTVQQSSTGISIKNMATLETGETMNLDYTLTPPNAVSTISWYSTNTTVATVDKAKGTITGKKAGETYIVATTSEGSSALCRLTVTQKASGIALLESSLILAKGSTTVLGYKLTPADATASVDWTSMENAVATVTKEGLVTAKGVGTTYIIATIADGYTATCKIKVIEKSTGITLDTSALTIANGESQTISYVLTPANATTSLTWKSMDNAIATVDAKGTVTAKGVGTTFVVVTSTDGYSTTCKVTVTQAALGISLAMTDLTLGVGDSFTMGYTLTPVNSTTRTVTWTSQDPKVASVNSDGKITGVSVGNTFIVAKIPTGAMTYLNVTVKSMLKGLAVDPKEKTVVVGKTFTIKPIFTPENATNKKVIWTSSDSSVATVSDKGKVKGIKGGTAMITCTAEDGGFVANCTVTVDELVTNVKLNKTSYKMTVGKTVTLKATVTSNYASNKGVTWSSSKKSVATVSQKGKVVAKKLGKTTIKAKAKDGSGEYATCSIRVIKRASSLKINHSYITVLEGKSKQLKTKVSPKSTTIKTLKWSTEDENIAVVSSKGKVTGVTPGTTKVTAKTTDGSNIKVSCTVVVKKAVPVTAMTLESNDVVMVKGTSQMANVTISPSGTTDKITYKSDNKSVATVSSHGKIKAKKVGTATITITASSGVETCMSVTVVGLNKTSLKLEQYDSDTLWVEGISDKVTWSSSNPAIARVDGGTVVARKKGSCTITAYVRGVKLKCSVTVTKM